MQAGLEHYNNHLSAVIQKLGETECCLGKLKGTYVAIEVLGGVGKPIRIPAVNSLSNSAVDP